VVQCAHNVNVPRRTCNPCVTVPAVACHKPLGKVASITPNPPVPKGRGERKPATTSVGIRIPMGHLPGIMTLSEDLQYQVLRLLDADPEMSQRQMARALGLSVGKTNYAIKAVLARGLVKAQNFRRSDNRSAYLYKLTPTGLQEKAHLAYQLLQRKRAEHEALMSEIEELRVEIYGEGRES